MSADITEERIAEIQLLAKHLRASGQIVGSVLSEILDAILSARSQLAALQSIPQGVEVPERAAWLSIEEMADAIYSAFGTHYMVCMDYARAIGAASILKADRIRARLAPTPPHPLQPEDRRVGPDEVVVDRDYLADLEESVIDTVEQLRVGFVLCENCGEQESTDTLDVMSMNLLPMIPRIEERRTSAQDHNGEGAK